MQKPLIVMLMIMIILVHSNTSVAGVPKKELKMLEDRIQNSDVEDRVQNDDVEGNEEDFHYYFKDKEESIDKEKEISSDYFPQFDRIVLSNSNDSYYSFSHYSTTDNNRTRQGHITVPSSSILPFIRTALTPLYEESPLLRAFGGMLKLFEEITDSEEIEKNYNITNMDIENVTNIEDNLSFAMQNNSVPR